MKIEHLPITILAGLLLAGTVQAGTLSCGDALITDDMPQGQSQQQILAHCGEPSYTQGDDWYYDRADVGEGTYILHFNASEQLDSIEQQMPEE